MHAMHGRQPLPSQWVHLISICRGLPGDRDIQLFGLAPAPARLAEKLARAFAPGALEALARAEPLADARVERSLGELGAEIGRRRRGQALQLAREEHAVEGPAPERLARLGRQEARGFVAAEDEAHREVQLVLHPRRPREADAHLAPRRRRVELERRLGRVGRDLHDVGVEPRDRAGDQLEGVVAILGRRPALVPELERDLVDAPVAVDGGLEVHLARDGAQGERAPLGAQRHVAREVPRGAGDSLALGETVARGRLEQRDPAADRTVVRGVGRGGGVGRRVRARDPRGVLAARLLGDLVSPDDPQRPVGQLDRDRLVRSRDDGAGHDFAVRERELFGPARGRREDQEHRDESDSTDPS